MKTAAEKAAGLQQLSEQTVAPIEVERTLGGNIQRPILCLPEDTLKRVVGAGVSRCWGGKIGGKDDGRQGDGRGGAGGEARAARERSGNGATKGDGAAPCAHFNLARSARMRDTRAAWRAAVLAGRSLRVHGAVAGSGVFIFTADLAMGAALLGLHPPIGCRPSDKKYNSNQPINIASNYMRIAAA